MTEPEAGELLVPKHELDDCQYNLRVTVEKAEIYYQENKQLRKALTKAGLFQSADNIRVTTAATETGNLKLRIPTWRRAREMAMDLLTVKMGHDDVPITIEYSGGKLDAIRTEK